MNLVPSDRVMQFFGYSNRAAFWQFVRTNGVPFIALNRRRYMFDPVELNAWIRKRNTSATPRDYTFEPQTTEDDPNGPGS